MATTIPPVSPIVFSSAINAFDPRNSIVPLPVFNSEVEEIIEKDETGDLLNANLLQGLDGTDNTDSVIPLPAFNLEAEQILEQSGGDQAINKDLFDNSTDDSDTVSLLPIFNPSTGTFINSSTADQDVNNDFFSANINSQSVNSESVNNSDVITALPLFSLEVEQVLEANGASAIEIRDSSGNVISVDANKIAPKTSLNSTSNNINNGVSDVEVPTPANLNISTGTTTKTEGSAPAPQQPQNIIRSNPQIISANQGFNVYRYIISVLQGGANEFQPYKDMENRVEFEA